MVCGRRGVLLHDLPTRDEEGRGGMMNILSLGAGVQSSTVLLLSCRGERPTLEAALFAETQWEPKAVYQWLAVADASG